MADDIMRYPEAVLPEKLSEAIPDDEIITITPLKCPKHEYYLEYWEVGTDHKEIIQGHFYSAAIKNFIRVFLSGKKYTIVYLKNVDVDRVVLNRRSTLGR